MRPALLAGPIERHLSPSIAAAIGSRVSSNTGRTSGFAGRCGSAGRDPGGWRCAPSAEEQAKRPASERRRERRLGVTAGPRGEGGSGLHPTISLQRRGAEPRDHYGFLSLSVAVLVL